MLLLLLVHALYEPFMWVLNKTFQWHVVLCLCRRQVKTRATFFTMKIQMKPVCVVSSITCLYLWSVMRVTNTKGSCVVKIYDVWQFHCSNANKKEANVLTYIPCLSQMWLQLVEISTRVSCIAWGQVRWTTRSLVYSLNTRTHAVRSLSGWSALSTAPFQDRTGDVCGSHWWFSLKVTCVHLW